MTLAHKAVSNLPLPPRPGSGNHIVSSTLGAYKLMSGHQMFLGACWFIFGSFELPSISGLLHIILDRVARQWRQL